MGLLAAVATALREGLRSARAWPRPAPACEVQLQVIKAALTRIDEGEYGLCDDCEERINLPRLAIEPTVLLCRTSRSPLTTPAGSDGTPAKISSGRLFRSASRTASLISTIFYSGERFGFCRLVAAL